MNIQERETAGCCAVLSIALLAFALGILLTIAVLEGSLG